MSFDYHIEASKAGAKSSVGRAAEAPKAGSSVRAVKSRLTGDTILLPEEEASLYEAHIGSLAAQYSPVGASERFLVQSIANADWRLERIRLLQRGIYALGHIEFAHLYAQEPEELRAGLIENKIYLAYKKQLRNLQNSERLILRHRAEDLAELVRLQATRKVERSSRRNQELTAAAAALIEAFETGTADQWNPREIGFGFSIAEIYARMNEMRSDLFRIPSA